MGKQGAEYCRNSEMQNIARDLAVGFRSAPHDAGHRLHDRIPDGYFASGAGARSGNLASGHPPYTTHDKGTTIGGWRNCLATGGHADAGSRDSLPYSSEGSPFGAGTKWLTPGQRPGTQDIGAGKQ